jgi:hypothetical protein
MDTKTNIKAEQYDDLGKGLNLFTRDTMLKENESTTAYNVWATGKNSITKRPGIVKLCTIAGVDQIDGLGTYYNGTTRKLLAMAGGTVYEVDTGTAVAVSGSPASAQGVFTTKNRTDWCQAGGKTFIANGVENIRYYDGTNIKEEAGSIVAKYLIYYKSCLWAAGNTGAGNGSRLYRSTDGVSGTAVPVCALGCFTYSNSAAPLATSKYVSQSDGQDLKGFFKHQDYLYPVKERSLWRASVGTDEYQLITLEMVDPARGTDSHFSIDTVDNDNFMFSEKGVFATGYEPNILDQIRTNIVSLRIDPRLQAIQKSRLDDVVALYSDNHYYLSYTSAGGTYNDTIMVYDRQRLGWWEFQVSDASGNLTGANCFTEFKNSAGQTSIYFGSATDGCIYYFDDSVKQDAGWSVITTWQSKKFEFGDYSQVKFFMEVELYFGKSASSPTINVYIDGVLAKTWTGQIGNTGAAGVGIESVGVPIVGVEGGSMDIADSGGGDWVKIPLNAMGRNVQIEVTEEDLTGTRDWELNALAFHYKPLSVMYQPGVKT